MLVIGIIIVILLASSAMAAAKKETESNYNYGPDPIPNASRCFTGTDCNCWFNGTYMPCAGELYFGYGIYDDMPIGRFLNPMDHVW